MKKGCRFQVIVLALGVMGGLMACSAGPDDDTTVFDDSTLEEADRFTQHLPVGSEPESEGETEDEAAPDPLAYPVPVGDDQPLDAERVPRRAAPGE